MPPSPAGFALAVAALAREAMKLAEEEDAPASPDARRAILAATRAAEDLATLAKRGEASEETYEAAARAVEAAAAELALLRRPGPRRLAVVLHVEVDESLSRPSASG